LVSVAMTNGVSRLIKPSQWVVRLMGLNCLVKVSPLPLGLIGLFRLVVLGSWLCWLSWMA